MGYTHYLWGNFALAPGTNVDSTARAIDRFYLDGGNALLPLTSPYGPGATWFELSSILTGIDWIQASARLWFLSRQTDPATGEPVNLVDTPYAGSPGIEANPHVDTWALGCKLASLPFGFLRLYVEPTLYTQTDYRNGSNLTWVEVTLGAEASGTASHSFSGESLVAAVNPDKRAIAFTSTGRKSLWAMRADCLAPIPWLRRDDRTYVESATIQARFG